MAVLPDTVQDKRDLAKLNLFGSIDWTVISEDFVSAKWTPEGEDREVLLSFDLTNRTVSLANDQPGDEDTVITARQSIDQPDPKLAVGRQITDRISAMVGVDYRDFAAGDLKLLLGVVLWNMRALNSDFTLRHPRHWVKLRDDS